MSFSVRTPEACICKMPDAVKDVEDLKLPEQANQESQEELLTVAKAAAIEVLESGKIGDADTGYRVTVSGHVGETPGLGDSLSISISATTATDPPQRS